SAGCRDPGTSGSGSFGRAPSVRRVPSLRRRLLLEGCNNLGPWPKCSRARLAMNEPSPNGEKAPQMEFYLRWGLLQRGNDIAARERYGNEVAKRTIAGCSDCAGVARRRHAIDRAKK